MASPCVVLVDTSDAALAAGVAAACRVEAQRIERKFSRYQPSVVTHINETAGCAVELDDETANLVDYAAHCHALSAGMFDITSGVLRRAWRFDGSDNVPSPERVSELLARVGWTRVQWRRPVLQLAPGMEIDFGGIGKEYAVDQALAKAATVSSVPVLVNFGGDLRLSGPRSDGSPWRVAIEDAQAPGATAGMVQIAAGALATSGDAHRFLQKNGKRFGHVLNPLTGWPIDDAPHAVTVHAATCSEAGLLAKLALLRGASAEEFLRTERVRSWIVR